MEKVDVTSKKNEKKVQIEKGNKSPKRLWKKYM